jgi:hypothetical protein
MADDSGSEHTRLAALVGTWETEGWTRAAPGVPAARIDALDTYEWLPGGFALLHSVDAQVGGESRRGRDHRL